jgi:hypothetical protein
MAGGVRIAVTAGAHIVIAGVPIAIMAGTRPAMTG